MKYTIFAEKDISSLNWAFEKSNFKTKVFDNGNIEVNVSNKSKDEFIKIISIYFSSVYYKEYYKNYLCSKLPNVEERVIDKIVSIDVENNENKIYIIQNLNILLKEYFKDNDVLCLESFLIFNATGFSKDIKFLAEMYCESYEDDLSGMFLNSEKEENMYSDEDFDDAIEDILDFENAVKSAQHTFELPSDISNIKRLDVLYMNGRITFLADETKKLEMNSLKSILSLDTLDDFLDDITLIYIIVGTVALLNIESLVIHKNIPKNSFEFFLKSLLKIKDSTGLSNTTIFKCKGDKCSKCKLK